MPGMSFLSMETIRLERTRTKVVANPIPKPFSAMVVTASVGQRPKTKRKGGSSCQNPLVNSLTTLMTRKSPS